jgi:hypothetical protein
MAIIKQARFSISKPKVCECSTKGLTMATLFQMHLNAQRADLRAAVLSMPVSTRAVAMSTLDVVLDAN